MCFFLFYVGIIYPSGRPISPHLLRYRAFAVKNHSRIPCASHLRQTRPVNNPGGLFKFKYFCKFLFCG
ncbi:MAG TPA: hypothetical protein ENI02_01875 [Candidatus Aminicenantes bacterium]|nr:hypothetical protein [Candidatus Aminicenantes bacterium]